MQQVIDRALDLYCMQQTLLEMNVAYAAIQSNETIRFDFEQEIKL